MSQPLRIAGFASSQSSEENVQLAEVSSSGQGPSQEREVRQNQGRRDQTPWQPPAQHIQYIELDDDDEEDQMSRDDVDVKDVKDRKKLFPDGMLGNIPRNMEVGAMAGPRIKGKKKFFYCKLCLKQLSSEETMISHVNGIPHCKKLELKEEDHRDKIRAGIIPPDEPLPEFVEQIPVPVSVKQKIPMRLHERIVNSEEPIIGLEYITEFLPESDPEMEPHYKCEGKNHLPKLSFSLYFHLFKICFFLISGKLLFNQ